MAEMLQASVRLADRVLVQVGKSLGERDDCEVVDLNDATRAALRAAWGQPHGKIYLAANGTVTFDAPTPPPPDPLLADKLRLWQYMAASGSPVATAISTYIADNANPPELRATMAALRSLIRVSGRGDSAP